MELVTYQQALRKLEEKYDRAMQTKDKKESERLLVEITVNIRFIARLFNKEISEVRFHLDSWVNDHYNISYREEN